MTRVPLVAGHGAAPPAQVDAIAGLGFTERQARFLVLVLRHAGVCVPRQYAQVAGIAQGAKCHAFFDRLVQRGHVRVVECVHNRARLYVVQSKRLYHAIGEPASRYRRPVSPRLVLDRLMVLDAVLATPVAAWLTTPGERAAAMPATGSATISADRPLGIAPDGRLVMLYLAEAAWPDAFRTFLREHACLLQRVPGWTLRIVFPRRLAHAYDDYQRAVHDELEYTLSASTIADLKRYFEARRNLHTSTDPQAEDIFRAGVLRFSTPRFDDLHRRWIKHGDEAFNTTSSPALAEALETGAGRVEAFVLPHGYQHLFPLVGPSRSRGRGVEQGVEKGAAEGATGRGRSQPRPSIRWPSTERSVVM